jgi:hypothetical protein
MMAAKLRIDLSQGLIEVEGSEAFILELYSDFKHRLSQTTPNIIEPSKPALSEAPHSPQLDPLISSHAPATPKPTPAAKTSTTSNQRKSKRSRKEEPKLLSDLDLNQGSLGRLKDFHARYAPKTNMEHNLIFTYFLKDGLNLEEITEDHLFTCYRTVQVKIPKALRQSVLDTAERKGWVDTDTTGAIRLTTIGRNHMEHDLAKSTDPE